jgi:hypothetical protein
MLHCAAEVQPASPDTIENVWLHQSGNIDDSDELDVDLHSYYSAITLQMQALNIAVGQPPNTPMHTMQNSQHNKALVKALGKRHVYKLYMITYNINPNRDVCSPALHGTPDVLQQAQATLRPLY